MTSDTDSLMPMNSEKENGLENDHQEPATEKVTAFNRNRAKRTRAYRKLEKKYVRTRNIAGLMVMVLLAGAVLSVASLKRVSNENKKLTSELDQANFRIEAFLSDMQTLRLDNDTLVQGRIPGLTPLKFDEPYKMENQTLKSVVFTRTKHNNKVLFEYLAVVHNTTQDVIRPGSLLIFFNKLGVEVGKGRIAISLDFNNRVKMIALQPGESHSFTGSIDMISNDEPRFFKLIEQTQ